jgi:hypothetical protein
LSEQWRCTVVRINERIVRTVAVYGGVWETRSIWMLVRGMTLQWDAWRWGSKASPSAGHYYTDDDNNNLKWDIKDFFFCFFYFLFTGCSPFPSFCRPFSGVGWCRWLVWRCASRWFRLRKVTVEAGLWLVQRISWWGKVVMVEMGRRRNWGRWLR